MSSDANDGLYSSDKLCGINEILRHLILTLRLTSIAAKYRALDTGCPQSALIETARECNAAGAALGLPFKEEVHSPDQLQGCFWDADGWCVSAQSTHKRACSALVSRAEMNNRPPNKPDY